MLPASAEYITEILERPLLDEPVCIGTLQRKHFKAVNLIRARIKEPLLLIPSIYMFPAVQQKLKVTRIIDNQISSARLAQLIADTLNDQSSEICSTYLGHNQALVRWREGTSEVLILGLARSEETSLKSAYFAQTVRIKKTLTPV